MGYMYNDAPKYVFIFLFMATNAGLFIGYFFYYYEGKQYYYLRALTGPSLGLSRAAAASLNFCCLCILLPVCRNCVSYVRGSLSVCCKRNIVRQLDKNISFHKFCAYLICFLSGVHIFAHTFNFEYFLDAHEDEGLLSALTNIGNSPGEVCINPIRKPNANVIFELLTTVAGITGVIITLALILIYSSSTETIRRSYFEVFWFTHHLFTIFFIGLMVHGAGGLVRSQSNMDVHDPHVCAEKYMTWDADEDCPKPTFQMGYAKTWYWVLGPVIIYVVERIIRFVRSQQKVVITKVVKHPSNVIEIQMQRKGFKMEAGQYIFLHCPTISKLEWHPFTLTSCPYEDCFSVHIRLVGDWTKALGKALQMDGGFQESSKLPTLAVDGPFGTASEDVYRYQTNILVGAGIGVTPWAAVLKDIWYRYCDPSYEMKLQKIYFFWICPDTDAFEWFSDLLKELESRMAEAGRPDMLQYNIYLTRGWDANQAMNIITHEQDEEDIITGLAQKTHFGRPNWDNVFTKVKHENTGTVGVFICGPKVLSTTLHQMCNKHSSGTAENKQVKFLFNKENF